LWAIPGWFVSTDTSGGFCGVTLAITGAGVFVGPAAVWLATSTEGAALSFTRGFIMLLVATARYGPVCKRVAIARPLVTVAFMASDRLT
jgi:hypothetical protein